MSPESGSRPKPTVVGIGASAGGLTALKTFLGHVPVDSELAFVVVVHLSPHHESHLAELLQSHTRLRVQQVSDTTLLESNNVYIIPPNANLNAIDTHLRLSKLEERRQERAPIDHFFRTLANTHDGHAIAVVLTGTGSDGTLGVKDIKANGGVVIVQEPNEAEYDGMPQSAIATGLVDFILPVAEIPDTILRFDRVQPRVPVVAESEEVAQDERALLHKIFAQLRVRTDRDFSRYKRSTVLRRIARRMQLNDVEDLERYVDMLRERPDEVRALADDLLITVTHFFRDPEVFEKLRDDEIRRLFGRKGSSNSIRAWSVGCATGEEAYSLAMLMVEEAGRHETPPQIQIFASDLHNRALELAREGFYPGDIATDVGVERLKRFFHEDDGGYRIRKEIRELVVFAPHNLLADPPFSRMDLISCRNLLIYLERDVQHDILELFHYALNPDGILLLGSAESVDTTDLFRVEDKKLCLFRKRNVPPREPHLPVFPTTRIRLGDGVGMTRAAPGPAVSYGSSHQRMVEKYAPPSILVGSDNRILHLSEHAGRYLVSPGGEPTHSAVHMVRKELRIELQAALQQAREKKEIFDSQPILVQFNGDTHPVVLHARPSLERDEDGFVLVIFEERELPKTADGQADPEKSETERTQALEEELEASRKRLQRIIEEYEAGREEMRASNEEMQSTNEELRSTMEELETSKEELQSVNEELQTVNQQNRHKVDELSLLSSDLQNLLMATDIATLFLDRELRIVRFTPKLDNFFNIRATDHSRKISDLTNRLGYPELVDDAESVLNKLVPVERELQDDKGRWYLTRLNPYRSTDDRIQGVVITFVDVTERKENEELRLQFQAHKQETAAALAMKEKEAELARVSRTLMVGELAASIAHEVNQPLAGMATNAEAALRWLEGESANVDEAKNSLALIVRDAHRASAVIQRVREFVRLDSTGLTVCDLREIIGETVSLLRFDFEKNHIVLDYHFSDDLPLVRGSRVQLQQVIFNLLLNASEAMTSVKDRSKELSVKAQQSANGDALVSIRDSGSAIDPESLNRIFEPFFTTRPGGIGMGASISQSIIQGHGGRIWATLNEDGPGLTVQFSLPAHNDKS